jgi:hypothetical protein
MGRYTKAPLQYKDWQYKDPGWGEIGASTLFCLLCGFGFSFPFWLAWYGAYDRSEFSQGQCSVTGARIEKTCLVYWSSSQSSSGCEADGCKEDGWGLNLLSSVASADGTEIALASPLGAVETDASRSKCFDYSTPVSGDFDNIVQQARQAINCECAYDQTPDMAAAAKVGIGWGTPYTLSCSYCLNQEDVPPRVPQPCTFQRDEDSEAVSEYHDGSEAPSTTTAQVLWVITALGVCCVAGLFCGTGFLGITICGFCVGDRPKADAKAQSSSGRPRVGRESMEVLSPPSASPSSPRHHHTCCCTRCAAARRAKEVPMEQP